MAAPAFRAHTSTFETTGTDAVLNVPAGTASGDYLLAFLYVTSGTPATPSGWVLLQSEPETTFSTLGAVYVYGKQAGSEPASYTWTGANFYLGIMAAYQHAQGVTLETSGDAAGLSSSMTAPSVTSGGADRRLVGYWAFPVEDTTTVPASMVARVTTDNNAGATHTVADQTVGSGATGTRVATPSGGGTNAWVAASVLLRPQNTAPNAPALLTPVGSSTFDRATAQRFQWSFSDPDFGDSQSGYDLRYQVVGSGSWTTVSGTTPNQFHDFAAATFAAGNYEWQARTYDAMGLVGAWSASAFFTAAAAPTGPTITAPTSGSTVAATPTTVTWSITSQASYQIRRVADSSGSPDTATVYSDTGEIVSTSARSASVAFPTNNRWEHIQLRTKDPTSGLWSSWVSSRVNVSYTVGVAPVANVQALDSIGAVVIGATNPTPNLLTANQASLETNTTGWAAGASTTIARSTTQASHGTASLRLNRSSGSGTVTATTPTGTSGVAVAANTEYTAMAEFRSTAGTRTTTVTLRWYTAAGALISSASFGDIADSTGWILAAVVATSPATAAFAAVEVSIAGVTSTVDFQYVDKISLHRGSILEWVLPSSSVGDIAVAYNDVYRRVAAGGTPDNDTPVGGDGVRVATHVAANGEYTDYAVAHAKDYEYKVVAVFTNTTTNESEWGG